MLLGNHEQMCLNAMAAYYEPDARRLWTSNGGNVTYRELCYHRSASCRHRILQFLCQLPDHLDIEVDDKRLHLVHGFPGNDTESRVWNRPELDTVTPIPGKTVILGHTPVPFLYPDTQRQEVIKRPQRIFHGNGFIDIDCGCGNKLSTRRLACLRLEDMQEFYT